MKKRIAVIALCLFVVLYMGLAIGGLIMSWEEVVEYFRKYVLL